MAQANTIIDGAGKNDETKAYLARIRWTIEASSRLVDEVGLRIAETDRMLERQGLTREQVLAMRFSEAQVAAANAELKRRGFDPIEPWQADDAGEAQTFKPSDLQSSYLQPSADSGAELAERQRKFGMMMKPFQI